MWYHNELDRDLKPDSPFHLFFFQCNLQGSFPALTSVKLFGFTPVQNLNQTVFYYRHQWNQGITTLTQNKGQWAYLKKAWDRQRVGLHPQLFHCICTKAAVEETCPHIHLTSVILLTSHSLDTSLWGHFKAQTRPESHPAPHAHSQFCKFHHTQASSEELKRRWHLPLITTETQLSQNLQELLSCLSGQRPQNW